MEYCLQVCQALFWKGPDSVIIQYHAKLSLRFFAVLAFFLIRLLSKSRALRFFAMLTNYGRPLSKPNIFISLCGFSFSDSSSSELEMLIKLLLYRDGFCLNSALKSCEPPSLLSLSIGCEPPNPKLLAVAAFSLATCFRLIVYCPTAFLCLSSQLASLMAYEGWQGVGVWEIEKKLFCWISFANDASDITLTCL